jgi:hypothetical protein
MKIDTKRTLVTLFKWFVAISLLAGSTIYLGIYPQDFTPIVNIFFSVFIALISYWIGSTNEIKAAIKMSNQKWLPQGESVIYRLLTLHSNVKMFAINSSQNCSRTSCELPELQKEELKALRIKLKVDCEANSQRLEDIAMQLEDAIYDWQRFIAANCDGEECNRIFEAILDRKKRLEEFIDDKQSKTKEQTD